MFLTGKLGKAVFVLAIVAAMISGATATAQQEQSIVCMIDMYRVMEAYLKIPGITSDLGKELNKTLDNAFYQAPVVKETLASPAIELASGAKKIEKKNGDDKKKESPEIAKQKSFDQRKMDLFQEKRKAMSALEARMLKDLETAVQTIFKKYNGQILMNTAVKTNFEIYKLINGAIEPLTQTMMENKFPDKLKGMRLFPNGGTMGVGGPQGGQQQGGMPGGAGMMPGMQGGMPGGGMQGGMPGGGGMQGGMPGGGGMQGGGMPGGGMQGGMPGGGSGMPGGGAGPIPGMMDGASPMRELVQWSSQSIVYKQGKDITDEVIAMLTQMKR